MGLDLTTPVNVGGVSLRQLPPDEWGRLAAAPGPLHGQSLPPTDNARVLVVEDRGQIVAYWVVSAMVHLDPLYIAPEYRQPHLSLALLGLLKHTLDEAGVSFAFAVIGEGEGQAVNAGLATRLGLERVRGDLYGGWVR